MFHGVVPHICTLPSRSWRWEPRSDNSPQAIEIFSSRWRDHGDDERFFVEMWFVESLALALGLSLRPQAEATILPIGSVGSRCDNSKDTVQTLVEKRGEEIRVAFKVNRMNHVDELVLLHSVMDFLLDGDVDPNRRLVEYVEHPDQCFAREEEMSARWALSCSMMKGSKSLVSTPFVFMAG